MTTYKDSGVDIKKGDLSSSNAGKICNKTIKSRSGLPMCHGPFKASLKNNFSEVLGFGKYFITHNSDGVGSKIKVAEITNKYDTLGYDLLAMVADDAICVGAETVYLSNIIDIDQVAPHITDELLGGLSKACCENKVIITGGEIAELPDIINGISWNASSIGMVDKDKIITTENVKPDDVIIGLRSNGFRSNGYTLARYILEKEYGKRWYLAKFKDETWGDVLLRPSFVYSSIILDVIGRCEEDTKVPINGIAHITGGGLSNLKRALNGYGCHLVTPLYPHPFMYEIMSIGDVSYKEAYLTWNMGTGMMLILDPKYVEQFLDLIKYKSVYGNIIGKVTESKICLFESSPELFTF